MDGPVAFFSPVLSSSERNHTAIEKEAHAVVKSVRKWRHYLVDSRFTTITDQRSVLYMFTHTHPSKVKMIKYKDGVSTFPATLSTSSIDKRRIMLCQAFAVHHLKIRHIFKY